MIRFDPARWRVPLGFAFAAVYLLLARPTPFSLALGVAVGALGLALRAYASGYIRKNDRLAVTGPYRYCRNPLYLGSAAITAGFLIAAAQWPLAVVAGLMFLLVYLPVIRSEERWLAERFGAEFEAYRARVPRLWPRRPAGGAAPGEPFSWALYRQHREYQALLGFLAVTVVLIAKYRFVRP